MISSFCPHIVFEFSFEGKTLLMRQLQKIHTYKTIAYRGYLNNELPRKLRIYKCLNTQTQKIFLLS